MKFSDNFILLISCGFLAGCSSPASSHTSKNDPAIQLTGTMPSRYDVTLKWRDSSPRCAGHIVEFATETNGQYTILGFEAANLTTFTHPRLVPDTTFIYRVRPYIGPASTPVGVSLPANLPEAEYIERYAKAEDYSWAAPETLPGETVTDRKSIRNPATAAAAAPVNLKATIAPETVSGVHLTWTDLDSDAEGYLIEMKADNDPDYGVCAVVGPGINSFGWSLHPPQRKGSFRVRAYYLGKPSNLVAEKTGPESEATFIPK